MVSSVFLLLMFTTSFCFWSIWCALEKKSAWWLISLFVYLALIFGYKFFTGNDFWNLNPL